MSNSCPHDPFRKARTEDGVLTPELNGERIPFILRYQDVRRAATDTKMFSSDAPMRVPIPAENDVRTVRQLPLEVDPPEHTDYRKLVDPFFRRPLQPEFVARMDNLIGELLDYACGQESVEVVRQFALPLQSRALTYLLNVPESEANIWIGWGTHVFRDGPDGAKKGAELEVYIQNCIERALAQPGDDFFSALTKATFRGRALTREEMAGYANIAFAGGRDTIINSITSIVGYVAEHPEALTALRDNPKLIITAGEEFVRAYSPVTHIGRMCPADTEVHGVPVKAGERISLCFASANFDETVFEAPEEIRLDRKPNPHIGFGFGAHNCVGAPHARLIIRTLLQLLCERVEEVTTVRAERKSPSHADYMREVGYHSLVIKFSRRILASGF